MANQATVSPLQGVEHLVTDAEGSELHIDTNRRVVYSTDGEEGILPSKYSFGCDPSVFPSRPAPGNSLAPGGFAAVDCRPCR